MEKYKISLLFVEDDSSIRELYTTILSSFVEELYTAANGKEGIKIFNEKNPDLIFTDIRMPELDGIKMTQQIKAIKHDSRIIIMSAYEESEYFIKAIEAGANGFLVKPINIDDFRTTIERQYQEILKERKAKANELKKKIAEEALKKREAILQAVSFAAETFLRTNYSEKTVPTVIEELGIATNASRVYIFQRISQNNKHCFKQKFEWCASGIAQHLKGDKYEVITDDNIFLSRLDKFLSRNIVFSESFENLSQQEKEFLQDQQVRSLIIVPVFVNERLWGFFGLDECHKERFWTDSEVNALVAAANIFGAAIHRNEAEQELKELNEELEGRIRERTKDLQDEIFERQQAEKSLRESEEKYRTIYENTNDGVILTIDGIIRFMNPKVYDMTGYFPKKVIQRPLSDIVDQPYKEIVKSNLIEAGDTDLNTHSDVMITDIYGREKWFEMKSARITWENQKAVISFLTDITERKKTAEELRQLNQNLEKRVEEEKAKIKKQHELLIQKSKLESLGELSAGMAHEINQPLGGLSMGLENIKFKLSDNSLSNQYIENKLQVFFDDIGRIKTIIEHVRDFSRDTQDQKFSPVNINDPLDGALSLFTRKFESHGVKITLKKNAKSPIIYGNVNRIEQVLLNLMSNAKFAVDKRKQLEGEDFQKEIRISTFNHKDKVILSVYDNGIGIPEKNINNIFDPFFTTKAVEEGTGLGLSISYGIITEMKGTLCVFSKEGKYTELQVILPEYHLE
ncbi:MAG: response regulator [Hyphomicrobiales bacterium]